MVLLFSGSLLDELETLQFFGGVVSKDMVFPTVHDAVLHCLQSRGRSSFSGAEQEV